MNIAELQTWLNSRGASLVVDGKGGPATRAAILSVFANKQAPAATDGDVKAIASKLDDPTGQRLRAVAKVESGGASFLPDGLPKILYERHYFWRLTQGSFGRTEWSWPQSGGYTVDADKDGVNDSWEKLAQAACRDPYAAFSSVSIGKFQVMGAHWNKLGYASPLDMMFAASRSEAAHYDMLARFILHFDLGEAFLRLSVRPDDCIAFAQGYNGPAFRKNSYHLKLAMAMQQ